MTLTEAIKQKTEYYTPKIQESFRKEFGSDIVNLNIQDNLAFVFDGQDNYWCKLTKHGVKKDSWRKD